MSTITVKIRCDMFGGVKRTFGPTKSLNEAKRDYEALRNLSGEGSQTFGFGEVFTGGVRTHTITYDGKVVAGIL